MIKSILRVYLVFIKEMFCMMHGFLFVKSCINGFRLQLREKHNVLRVVMNANVSTTPLELGLSPVLALVDSASLETPYLAAIDILQMIVDVASPSAKLNIIGIYLMFLSYL